MAAYYLRPSTGGAIPPVVLSVGLSTKRRTTKIGRIRQTYLDCSAWAVCLWDIDSDANKPIEQFVGDSPRHLWTLVGQSLDEQSITWLWCRGMRELLILTDWYAALECGRWSIGGRNGEQEVQSGLGMKRHFRGYLIDADPPNIVLARHEKTGNVIQIVDTANFGVDDWSDMSDVDIVVDTAKERSFLSGKAAESQAHARALLVGSWAVGWSRLVKEKHWGPLRPTAASQALTAFTTSYMKHLVLVHDDEQAKQLERQAYYPGRCEAFRIGFIDGPVYHLDVKACYPAISRCERIPCRYKGTFQAGQGDISKMAADGWLIVADVTIETGQANYPYREDGNIVYPMGRFRTVLCWPELEDAINNGRVTKIHKVARYEGEELLHEWSAEMLKMRSLPQQEDMPSLHVGIKCLTNSLYGAFAKRARRWISCPHRPPPGPYTVWYGRICSRCCPDTYARSGQGTLGASNAGDKETFTRWRSIGWRSEFEIAERESRDAIPQISAWVCSLGRRYLLRLLETAGRQNVFYCDTDSLWVNERGIDNLSQGGYIRGSVPGHLGIKDSFSSIIIHGHKSYSAGLNGAHCGVPNGALIRQDGSAEWESMESVVMSIKRHEKPVAVVVNRRRGTPSAYTGGQVMPDGRVTPLWIWDQTLNSPIRENVSCDHGAYG
jgi:hypothetical protein